MCKVEKLVTTRTKDKHVCFMANRCDDRGRIKITIPGRP
jgi:hypothetical protein